MRNSKYVDLHGEERALVRVSREETWQGRDFASREKFSRTWGAGQYQAHPLLIFSSSPLALLVKHASRIQPVYSDLRKRLQHTTNPTQNRPYIRRWAGIGATTMRKRCL